MAQWVAAQGGERAGEYDALIAEHYEKASEYYLAAQHLEKASRAAFDLGAYQDGTRAMERGLSLLDKSEAGTDQINQRMNMQMNLAHPLGFLGKYEQTRILLESALESARKLEDRQSEANTLAQLGRLTGLWQEDAKTGRAYLEEALKINQELDDKEGLVFILRQLGNVGQIDHQYEESIRYLEQSLQLARELDQAENIANALNSLGTAATGLDDVEAAFDYFQEALDIARKQNDEVFTAMIVSNIATLYTDMEDYETARQMAQEAMIAATEANSHYLLADDWTLLGWAALGLEEDEIAGKYILKGLQIFQELDSDFGKAHGIALYAWLMVRIGDYREALSWLKPAKAAIGPLPWFDRLIDKILAELPAAMSEAERKELMAKGTDVVLNDVVSQILRVQSLPAPTTSPDSD
jgi:tetratricopeptide (TPR) repeat protein